MALFWWCFVSLFHFFPFCGQILGKLNEILTEWIKQVLRSKGFTEEAVRAASAGSKIYTFGSYRLGVHGRDTDIDTLCIGPRAVEISDFFTTLVPMLRARDECTRLVAVTEAYVPVIKLEFSGVDIDLLYARLATNSVPQQLDLQDDALIMSMGEEKREFCSFVVSYHLRAFPRRKIHPFSEWLPCGCCFVVSCSFW